MMEWCYRVAALAGICLLSGCQQPQEPQAEATAPATQAAKAPTLPLDPPYDRQALLMAVMHAASDAALGTTDEAKQRTLDGKRFELRLRFGCAAGDDGNPSRDWAFDEKRRKLSLRVEPEITGDSPLARLLGEGRYEAVEGFWILRPWMLTADCPAVPTVPPSPQAPSSEPPDPAPAAVEPAPLPAQPSPRIGLAQFFSETDARTHRRDSRAYSAAKVLPADVSPSRIGYDLVITGRLRRLANGPVIACANRDRRQPPECIISAKFDSVAIEQPATGETIAKWSSA